MYAYIIKHKYVLGGMLFTIRKAQLYVSAINVGHLQVVQRKLIDQVYMHMYGVYRVQGRVVSVGGGGPWLWAG
jgi:hypothetical protein